DGLADRHCQQRPAMNPGVVLCGNATDQKANAAAKREALPFQLLEIVLGLAKSRRFELRVGAGRKIKDRNDDLTFTVLETGKACAQLHVARGFEAYAEPRRKNRLGEGEWDTPGQSGQDGEQVRY